MELNDTQLCPKCNTHILKKCAAIHKVACKQSKNIKPKKKQKGFFQSLFSSDKAQYQDQQQSMIPCTECGQSFPFSVFAMHQNQCVGHQLTKCNQCRILFPTFLFEEHTAVCQGPKQVKQEMVEEQQEDNFELYEMIENIAINQVKKENFDDQPLTENQLKQLQLTKIKIEEDCSVCCCPMMVKNKQILLNCKHIFHKDCIHSWLRKNPFCPMCRQHAFKK